MRACQAAVDSLEFTEWLAYFRLVDGTPTPADRRADWRHAEQMTLLANAYRNPKRRPAPFSHAEFLPAPAAPAAADADAPSDDAVRDAVRQMNAAFGGRVAG